MKVKGYLRKIGWKCESGIVWKVEVLLEPNMVYGYNVGSFVCSCSQRSYFKVISHQRSSCKINSKCKIHLILKVGVRLKPNFIYWYYEGTFILCSWDQRSHMKVKGHVRSVCKIVWKFASSTNYDGRWHQPYQKYTVQLQKYIFHIYSYIFVPSQTNLMGTTKEEIVKLTQKNTLKLRIVAMFWLFLTLRHLLI